MQVKANQVLIRAAERRQRAFVVIEDLKLVERWSHVGRVVLVGGVAYDLVVSLDIDFEVFTSGIPKITDGFRVLAELAEHPQVTKAHFSNDLSAPDQGLYWQLRYVDDVDDEWRIDLWTLAEDHPGPLSAWMVEPMQRAVTDEVRERILVLKEARAEGRTRPVASIDLYRAVIQGGVRTPEELDRFLGPTYSPSLTAWKP
jgi:hypothetical protein